MWEVARRGGGQARRSGRISYGGGVCRAVLAVLLAALVATSCRSSGPLRPLVPGDDPASRTAAYLIARGDQLDPQALLVVNYLKRKFGLTWAEPLVASLEKRITDPRHFSSVGVFARMVDPRVASSLETSITSTIAGFESISTTYVLLRGLYCDWSPPPPGFLENLQRFRQDVRFWRITSLLSYGFLKANRCIEGRELEAVGRNLHRQYAVFLDGIVASGESPGAEFVETVGGMYFAFGRELVAPQWVEYVIANQETDGTWRVGPNDESTRDFTAVWGLAAVLEFMHPEVPDISPIPN
jgi:hypothetical protein